MRVPAKEEEETNHPSRCEVEETVAKDDPEQRRRSSSLFPEHANLRRARDQLGSESESETPARTLTAVSLRAREVSVNPVRLFEVVKILREEERIQSRRNRPVHPAVDTRVSLRGKDLEAR